MARRQASMTGGSGIGPVQSVTRVGMSLAAVALVGLLSACDDQSPTAPRSIEPSPLQVVRLEIVGPRSVAPGETVQFGVKGTLSDGSTQDMTSQASWQSQQGLVLALDATGRATGQELGESILTARVASRSATAEIVVVPAGTYRLSVIAREAGVVALDVRLEVTDGRGASFSDTTAVNGRFDVYGVAGDSQVRVKGASYQDYIQRVVVTDHVLLTVEMVADRPRLDVSGTYTLTIAADPTCRDRLPEDLRTRRYGARVTQLGPEVAVALDGAALVTGNRGGGRFVGRMDANSARVVFKLFVDFYYAEYFAQYPPDLFEALGGSRYLAVSGSAATSVSASALSGVLNGSIWITDVSRPWPTRRVAECPSTQHAFILSR